MSLGGMKIWNKDRTSWKFDATCTAPAILGYGYYNTVYYTTTLNLGIKIPEGSDYYLWLATHAAMDYLVERSQWTPRGVYYYTTRLDSNRNVLIDSHNEYGVFGHVSSNYYSLFTFPLPDKTGKGGLKFIHGNSFSTISDISKFSFLKWKGDIDLRSGWTPSSIDSSITPNNTIVFFYLDNETVTVHKDFDGVYRLYSSGLGEYYGVVKAKVIIFGDGGIKKSRAGVRVHNPKTKEIVFDSANEIMVSPKVITMVNKGLGEYTTVPGVARPMITPTQIGGEYYAGWFGSIGVNSNGTQIAPQRGRSYYVRASHGPHWLEIKEIPVMVLDAENYFNF
ncbi:hypothetical protein [Candidatus Symbiopectobacterium sp. NZEC135]|uniref:hypothetical protein n=1 Tax=Candidatus Symbiopectobacterium sp. NZEC135 TaxID=2820471 RepID=UPI0022264423|nr:hypothetical protein [Candidatus Symbiopectobacterium sp. NZEC135]MCW2480348.1 hypothetical protein [Candidatus Symbiopectobacterium sp. NZEC135]